jgi:hypothetical protein
MLCAKPTPQHFVTQIQVYKMIWATLQIISARGLGGRAKSTKAAKKVAGRIDALRTCPS